MSLQNLIRRADPLPQPSLTPEYIIAVASTLVGLFLTQGLIDNTIAKALTGAASVLIPLAFLIGQAIVKAVAHKPPSAPVTPPPVTPTGGSTRLAP